MATIEQLALCLTPGIGPTGVRQLTARCTAAELFGMSAAQLAEVAGPRRGVARAIAERTGMARAEEEMRFMERHGIRALFMTDEGFPRRLLADEAADCPALVYVAGSADLNAVRTLSVVGTRRATPRGRSTTEAVVRGLGPTGATVVSGLAYGIDTAAHTAAVEHGLPTVAVLGHGLDRIYPPENRGLADRIMAAGGALLTEYPSGTAMNARYFPARNRIIAALGDATLVVEASAKGGALITAAIAGGYHRPVMAVPGRLDDTYAEGTNNLIATGKASLVRGAADVAWRLGWPLAQPGGGGRQGSLFDLRAAGADAQRVAQLLGRGEASLDELVERSAMPMPQCAAALFELETLGLVQPMPGRMYRLKVES